MPDEEYVVIQKYDPPDSDTIIYYDQEGLQHVIVVEKDAQQPINAKKRS